LWCYTNITDVVSLRISDNVTSENDALVIKRFMEEVPQSPKAIEKLKDAVYGNPFFVDKIVSKDGKATAGTISKSSDTGYSFLSITLKMRLCPL